MVFHHALEYFALDIRTFGGSFNYSFWESTGPKKRRIRQWQGWQWINPRGLSLSSLPAIGSFLRWRGEVLSEKWRPKNEKMIRTLLLANCKLLLNVLVDSQPNFNSGFCSQTYFEWRNSELYNRTFLMRDFLPNLPFETTGSSLAPFCIDMGHLRWLAAQQQIVGNLLRDLLFGYRHLSFCLDFLEGLGCFLGFQTKVGGCNEKTLKTMFSLKPAAFDSEQKRALRWHHGWSGLGSFGTRCTKRCVPDADPEVVILGRVPKVKSISFWKVLYIYDIIINHTYSIYSYISSRIILGRGF